MACFISRAWKDITKTRNANSFDSLTKLGDIGSPLDYLLRHMSIEQQQCDGENKKNSHNQPLRGWAPGAGVNLRLLSTPKLMTIKYSFSSFHLLLQQVCYCVCVCVWVCAIYWFTVKKPHTKHQLEGKRKREREREREKAANWNEQYSNLVPEYTHGVILFLSWL